MEQGKQTRTLISAAFEGDSPPGPLSVAVVSLVELSQHAMPDPAKIRASLAEANFTAGKKERANEAGAMLALDSNMVSGPVRNLSHEIYMRDRHGEPVIFLLSEGDTDKGKIVFISTIFRGAIEADVVKAAAHVTQKQPFTGATTRNADGKLLRRVFWDVEGAAGIRGLVASGPENVDADHLPRALTVFNKVASRS